MDNLNQESFSFWTVWNGFQLLIGARQALGRPSRPQATFAYSSKNFLLLSRFHYSHILNIFLKLFFLRLFDGFFLRNTVISIKPSFHGVEAYFHFIFSPVTIILSHFHYLLIYSECLGTAFLRMDYADKTERQKSMASPWYSQRAGRLGNL